MAKYRILPQNDAPFTIAAYGREAWALEQLMTAGARGCTPITNPAPRWSHYIHMLRQRRVPIETLREPHGGPFAGTHGRYVLLGRAEKVDA